MYSPYIEILKIIEIPVTPKLKNIWMLCVPMLE
jgi:hypothetical protein